MTIGKRVHRLTFILLKKFVYFIYLILFGLHLIFHIFTNMSRLSLRKMNLWDLRTGNGEEAMVMNPADIRHTCSDKVWQILKISSVHVNSLQWLSYPKHTCFKIILNNFDNFVLLKYLWADQSHCWTTSDSSHCWITDQSHCWTTSDHSCLWTTSACSKPLLHYFWSKPLLKYLWSKPLLIYLWSQSMLIYLWSKPQLSNFWS